MVAQFLALPQGDLEAGVRLDSAPGWDYERRNKFGAHAGLAALGGQPRAAVPT
jgi:hypothetical protein